MKSIMFKDNMLQAVLDSRKTQTRRIIKPQPRVLKPEFEGQPTTFLNPDYIKKGHKEYCHPSIDIGAFIFRYSRYQVGDIVGIRENYEVLHIYDTSFTVIIKYLYDNKENEINIKESEYEKILNWKNPLGKKSKLFMFDSLIRHKIQITDIRVEKVQDISDTDARYEGVYRESDASGYLWYENYSGNLPSMFKQNPIKSFMTLWDSINKKRGYGWEVNPWVWVVEFKQAGGK